MEARGFVQFLPSLAHRSKGSRHASDFRPVRKRRAPCTRSIEVQCLIYTSDVYRSSHEKFPDEICTEVGAFVLFLPILAHRSKESSHASVILLVCEIFSLSPLSLATFSANTILERGSLRFFQKA